MSKESISKDYLNRLPPARRAYPSDREALVVGCNNLKGPKNIGDAISDELVREGFQVASTDVDDLDVQFLGSTKRFFDTHEHTWDTLVYAAGVNELNWFEDQGNIYDQITVNLLGAMEVSQEFIKRTIDDNWIKTIVFIGSMAYNRVLNGSAAYCASKAGLAHFAKCLGFELTPKGYRVFCVHPSNVENSPMSEATVQGLMKYRDLTEEQARDYWATGLLMPEWLQKDDVAGVVAQLAKGEHGLQYLTGTNIELSGGQR